MSDNLKNKFLSLLIFSGMILILNPVFSQEKPVLVDKIAAVVNGSIITMSEIDLLLGMGNAPVIKSLGSINTQENQEQRKKTVLDQLINDRLLVQEAEKLDIKVSKEEIDQHVREIIQENNWDEESFAQAVHMLGFTDITAYREHASRELLKGKIVKIKVASKVKVSDQEAEEEFQKQYRDGEEELVKASHIFIKTPNPATLQQINEARNRAEKALEMIDAGKKTFDELAAEISEDSSAKRGGDIGYFGKGTLEPTFEKVAFAMKKGETSGIVQTSLGFHIIKVTDKKTEKIRDIEEAKSRIKYELFQKNFEKCIIDWIKELRMKANIKINI
jgi:parvulin-like peptidyl-prolyl isomerase